VKWLVLLINFCRLLGIVVEPSTLVY